MSWLFSIVRQSQTAYHCGKGEVDPPIQPYSSLIRFVGPCNTQVKISPRSRSCDVSCFALFLLLVVMMHCVENVSFLYCNLTHSFVI